MKKKWLFGALSAICGLSFGLAISACGDETPNDAANNGTNDNAKIEAIYDEYVIHAEAEGITPLSYEDWLQSIKGADGKSAYQIWLDNGHTGTETDFLNWLKGGETATEETYTAGVHYQKIKGKDEYRVMGIGIAESTDIVIADTYKGLPVTEIAESAFRDCSSLTSIEIPDGVTSIGSSAFEDCESLTSVVIGDSVTSIGDYAFEDCSSLTSIEISDSVTDIGSGAFEDCSSLTSVVIPDSVTSIGEYAFAYCTSLTSVVIGNGVTDIASVAFAYCDSLTNITVDKNNTSYKGIDGNLYTKDGKTLLQYAIGKSATNFTVPNGVTSIGSSAFSSCESLTSVVIPDRVTDIGVYVFENCTSLTSVVIGDGVTDIGNYAFENCTSLTSVAIGDSVTSIGQGAFCNCNSLTSVYYKGTAEEWGNITFATDNAPLQDTTRYYYSETEPAATGNYWHYDENGEIVVW